MLTFFFLNHCTYVVTMTLKSTTLLLMSARRCFRSSWDPIEGQNTT